MIDNKSLDTYIFFSFSSISSVNGESIHSLTSQHFHFLILGEDSKTSE
nr:hypothetical protein Itr_chr13CG08410 [Ipomoea trifida]